MSKKKHTTRRELCQEKSDPPAGDDNTRQPAPATAERSRGDRDTGHPGSFSSLLNEVLPTLNGKKPTFQIDSLDGAGFGKVPLALFGDPRLSSNAILVWAAMSAFARGGELSYAGQKKLAQAIRKTVRTVHRAIRELKRHGYVVERRRGLTLNTLYILKAGGFPEGYDPQALASFLKFPDRTPMSGQEHARMSGHTKRERKKENLEQHRETPTTRGSGGHSTSGKPVNYESIERMIKNHGDSYLLDIFSHLGIKRSLYREFLGAYGERRLRAVVRFLCRQKRKPRNPGGWVRRALEEAWNVRKKVKS